MNVISLVVTFAILITAHITTVLASEDSSAGIILIEPIDDETCSDTTPKLIR